MSFSDKFRNFDIFGVLVKVTVVLVICLGFFAAYQLYTKVPSVRENVTLATTKNPEAFTELYFENHASLPSLVREGDIYPFSFTIHNLEHKTMEYPYEVFVETDGGQELIGKKTVTLDQNNSVTVGEELVVKTTTRSAVVVNLINKNQKIRFWIEGEK